MKKVLVTGATGFVGANLARQLLTLGHEVHLIVRAESNMWRLQDLLHDLYVHEVALEDAQGVSDCLKSAKPKWIFHLAAHGAYSWQNDFQSIVTTNIVGTSNLLSAALNCGFDSFINTGSSSEYGLKDKAASEQEYLEPNSYYAATKASATLLCRTVARLNNLQIPTLRLYSAYGPFEDPGRLIPTIVRYGLAGGLPPLVAPDTARDFVYIDDVIDAYLQAAATRLSDPGAIFNVGSGRQTTIKQVVDIVRAILDISETPNWGSMDNRNWDTNIWVANNEKIKESLGWSPRHSFKEGFQKTLGWIKQNEPLWQRYNISMLNSPEAKLVNPSRHA
jgi:nucleoside-diphosphate-sugar epimerase